LNGRVYDVCIIGSGAAGISIANELNQTNLSVALLEAGGAKVNPASQELFRSLEDTKWLGPNYLQTMRLRALGGTTGHWMGEGRPFDEIDFERRDWIPYSGWPIQLSEIMPYYERAAPYCGFPNSEKTKTCAIETIDSSESGGRFSFKPLYRADPVPRFGEKFHSMLSTSKNISVFLESPVVDFQGAAEGSEISSAVVLSKGGRKNVRARKFVLAAGTVENARILLSVARKGGLNLGPEREFVGRFFMEHSEGWLAQLRAHDSGTEVLKLIQSSQNECTQGKFIPALCLSPKIQKQKQLLNMAFEVSHVKVPAGGREALRAEFRQIEEIGRFNDFLVEGKEANGKLFNLNFRCESRPDPANRVSITDELDSLGLFKTKLYHRWNETDLLSLDIMLQLLAQEFGLRNHALVRQLQPAIKVVRPSNHQMGTTRMGINPSSSVVDQNCKVHSLANLFISGSSVFPTVGWVNPTFTIVALSLRLADHLKATTT
jgi:hypothetical protein